MRPGLVFIGLFVVLFIVYLATRDSLSTLMTALLQLAIVLVILGAATWYRAHSHRRGWFFFGDDNEAEDGTSQESSGTDDGDDQVRKAS